MSKIKTWLDQSNGWKRVWFVLTILGLLYSVYLSIFDNNQTYSGISYFKNDIHEDFQKTECKPYIYESLESLKKPDILDNCYYIYLERSVLPKDIHPYTEDTYLKELNFKYWSGLGSLFSVYSLITLFLSGIVYLIGWVIYWIIKGFKK